ncbi:MAG: FAD-dependent oxidoreductase [Candidatus Microsaccharimonas sp.]
MIDSLLNRFSMYKVLSITLTSLWVIALIFSFFGIISYSPLAMVASIGVLGTVVFLASLLFGLLFGVKVHTESSYITAFILFFIFTPTLQVGGLATLALGALIAAASKFVLVYKGRHIFNPAVIAAFIIGLTGLGVATWWVATPPLFIFTLLFGFLIIQKTRRFLTGGIFLGITIPLLVITQLGYGSTLPEAFYLLLSWPIFYFSAFMLTEPQTLPPKKWQQVFEVIIVAILFAVPFTIGPFHSNLTFALVVGNIIAFGFSRRQAIYLKFKGFSQLTPMSRELTFTSAKKIAFEAGQYVELSLPHKGTDLRGERRSFSITSSPTDKDVKLGIKFYDPSSSFKKALGSLAEGTTITATSINGSFTLPKDAAKPLLFIAGGIGITPFMSQLRLLKKRHEKRDIVLVYAVSSTQDLAYKDELEAMDVTVIVVTKSDTALTHKAWTLVNEARITEEVLRDTIDDIAKRQVYISGPPFMIDGTKKALKRLGVRRIKTDYFIGY